jgi:hypothetical protein
MAKDIDRGGKTEVITGVTKTVSGG